MNSTADEDYKAAFACTIYMYMYARVNAALFFDSLWFWRQIPRFTYLLTSLHKTSLDSAVGSRSNLVASRDLYAATCIQLTCVYDSWGPTVVFRRGRKLRTFSALSTGGATSRLTASRRTCSASCRHTPFLVSFRQCWCWVSYI